MTTAADRKCPHCGRFAPEPNGYYDTDPPGVAIEDSPSGELRVYCDEQCRNARMLAVSSPTDIDERIAAAPPSIVPYEQRRARAQR